MGDEPLDPAKGVNIKVSYPVTLSYKDFQSFGNQYNAHSYLMIQDAGVDDVRGSGVTQDINDIDEDSNVEEKIAVSSDTAYVYDTISEWREYVSKYVKTAYSDGFTNNSIVRLDQYDENASDKEKAESDYCYRIDFGLGAANAKNITFFDNIETGAEVPREDDPNRTQSIRSEWHGNLVSVDTTRAEKMGMTATVYYSENANQSFDLEASGWTTEIPADMSKVRSVAVHLDTSELPDGMMKMKQMTYVLLNMRAASDRNCVDKTAVNQATVVYDSYDTMGLLDTAGQVLPSSETRIRMMDSVGKLSLQKVDGDDVIKEMADGSYIYKALPGASFTIYDAAGNVLVDNQAANSLGRITLKDIPYGTYYYEETKAPAGYEKLEGSYTLRVGGVDHAVTPIVVSAKNVSVNVPNSRIPGIVRLTKYDADNAGYGPLAGAEYGLYTSAGMAVKFDASGNYDENGTATTVKTGEDGTLTVRNIPWGKYYFKEVNGPQGYEVSEERISFEINRDNVGLNAENEEIINQVEDADREKLAGVRLRKEDANTGTPLRDAMFNLWKKNASGNWVKLPTIYKTNAAGEFEVEGLKFGEYKFVEVKAPKGYRMPADPEGDAEVFELDASTAETMVEVVATNERMPGTAMVIKSAEDGTRLADAEYVLYKADGTAVETVVTNEHGETPAVQNLAWGTYYFKETKAPKGYDLNPSELRFTVTADNASVTMPITLEAVNNRIRGTVVLTKYDEATKGILLPDAEFALYTKDGVRIKSMAADAGVYRISRTAEENANETFKTGAGGIFTVEGLDWGTYYFEETKAPAGYGLSTEKVQFVVSQGNCAKTQQLYCYDPVKTGTIKIKKEINEQYEAFGVPTFVYRVEGQDISGKDHRWTTSITLSDSNAGETIVAEVPAGTYTVKEIEVGRYLLDKAQVTVIPSGSVEDGIATVTVTDDDYEVYFRNNMNQYEKFSHMTNALNVVNAKRKLTSMVVEYLGDDPITEQTEGVVGGHTYTFKDGDIKATAYYDDGSTKEIPFSELILEGENAKVTGDDNPGKMVTVGYAEDAVSVTDSFTVGLVLAEPPHPHYVTCDANGGTFGGETELNRMGYVWQEGETVKVLHTDNLDDDGHWDGTTPYSTDYVNGKSVNEIGFLGDEATGTINLKYKYDVDYGEVQANGGYAYTYFQITGWKENHETASQYFTSYSNYRSGRYHRCDGGSGEKTQTFSSEDLDFVRISWMPKVVTAQYGWYVKMTYTGLHNMNISGNYIEPVQAGKVFMGWYTDPTCAEGTEYQFKDLDELKEDITVYAKWRDLYAEVKKGNEFYSGIHTYATSFKKSDEAPDLSTVTATNVASANSDVPIYMWYDSTTGTEYWWCEVDSVYVVNAGSMFSGRSRLKTIDLNGLDFSKNVSTSSMFSRCSNLTSLDVSGFDTSNVTNMASMFEGCNAITSLDVSGFDTSKVTDMSNMFSSCSSLTRLDVSNFDTSNVTNMDSMFYYCSGLTSLDLSDFDTSKVTNMRQMFYYCSKLTSLDVSHFDTSNVTYMFGMFYKCSDLTNLDVSGFDTGNVTMMVRMFEGCNKLVALDVSGFNTSKVTTMSNMFSECSSLTGLDVSGFNTSKVTDMEDTIVSMINTEETKQKGSRLDVLKHGIDLANHHLDLMYTKPATTFNAELNKLYDLNVFSATEEVWASEDERVDIVIFLNGLAVFTFELKCNAAGQSYEDAIYQYRMHRNPKTRLFRWKAGALVHFAMDLEQVYMTTKLDKESTFFLPFNMGNGEGIDTGAGNPIYKDKFSVYYMWEDILQKDTMLEIFSKFMFIEVKEKKDPVTDKVKRSETVIFPRYHQLDCIRKVLNDLQDNGTLLNYLIQHSTGSGKTNTIAWLAHRLASLHDKDNKVIFDNIIICTDRVVVDRQLQQAVMGIEHKAGLIRVMDDKCHSDDLGRAIEGNTKIIATTIQKFPYIVDKVKKTSNKHFAVIIDEAHSSTAGKNMAAVTLTLSNGDELVYDTEDMIVDEIARHGKQKNVSMFAFTATPKPTTLQLFGRENAHGQRGAFHLYSMKQAIEEGFILDVLQNYVTYDTYYKLNKEVQDDPKLQTNSAKRQIARFVQLHETNIAQRIEVIIEHFRTTVAGELGGHAKAMVITESRAGAVRYRQAFENYIQKKGYTGIHALVAFSGKVSLDGEEYTESGMNGIPEKNLPGEFDKDDYQVLLVADKYQTGFDQPKLCAMYILKKLHGVAAVQTLSRLNRICPPYDKHTFILDFANKYEDIVTAFSKYYTATLLTNSVTPTSIYDIEAKIDGYFFLDPGDIEVFNKLWYESEHNAKDKKRMTFLLQKTKAVIDGYDDEKKAQVALDIRHFIRFYEFLIQVSCFEDKELHKKYNFLSALIAFIRINHPGRGFNLDGMIEASGFVQKKKEEHKKADMRANPILKLPQAYDIQLTPAKEERLSKIIRDINSRTGKNYDNDVAIKAALQIRDIMKKSDELKVSAQNNTEQDFEFAYFDHVDDALIDGLEQNQDFFSLLLQNDEIKRDVLGLFASEIYHSLRA